MAEHVTKTIADIVSKIEDLERKLAGKKKMVNMLCEMENLEPRYPDVEESTSRKTAFRTDEFYTQPLATAVRKILEARQSAMTAEEIYEALKSGGFQFDHKNAADAKRGLKISLSKNTTTFHKLPNDTFGLLEFYDIPKNGKGKEQKPKEADPEPSPEELGFDSGDTSDASENPKETISPKG